MPEERPLLDLVMAGDVLISEIDDFIDRWHAGHGEGELHDFLGMTSDEYALWVGNSDMLGVICAARRRGQPLVEAVNDNIAELRLAARAANGLKLRDLQAWLRRQGVVA